MAVMMQAFYWDAPKHEKKEHEWWNFLAEKVEDLGRAGFNALWPPPVNRAASNTSMGYDPYDYFDLGDFDQKGGTKTWWGTGCQGRSKTRPVGRSKSRPVASWEVIG